MDRREFLRGLICGSVAATSSKFIFDYGANLHSRPSMILLPNAFPRRFSLEGETMVEVLPFKDDGLIAFINPAWQLATHEEIVWMGNREIFATLNLR